MQTDYLNRAAKLLKHLLVTVSVIYLGGFLFVALLRIQYPFELEWVEGSMVDHVGRVLSGEKIYVKPSIDFIPFLYTPLYYYSSAALSYALGIGFLPLRLVSLASSLGSFYIIYLIVKQETSSKFSAMLASCLFAATYRIGGAWFDVARVDSLFLFLLLATLYWIRFRRSLISQIIAGIFFSLSFLTKQIALPMFFPVILYCIYRNWRFSLLLIGTIGAIIGGSTFLFNHISDGWYFFYVFENPSHHQWINNVNLNFWIKDLFLKLPIAFSMFLCCLYRSFVSKDRETYLFYFCMSIGMLMGSWLSRLHIGGYDNVLIPAYACICIVFGIETNRLLEYISNAPMAKRGLLEIATFLMCITQFAVLYYNPISQVPTREDLQAGCELVRKLEKVEGEVMLPFHGYLPALANKKTSAHILTIWDILRGADGKVKSDLILEIRNAIRSKRFDAIFVDDARLMEVWLKEANWLYEIERAGYCVRNRPVFSKRDVFWPVTGGKVRPEIIFCKCPA